jgi:hypothetical protein
LLRRSTISQVAFYAEFLSIILIIILPGPLAALVILVIVVIGVSLIVALSRLVRKIISLHFNHRLSKY